MSKKDVSREHSRECSSSPQQRTVCSPEEADAAETRDKTSAPVQAKTAPPGQVDPVANKRRPASTKNSTRSTTKTTRKVTPKGKKRKARKKRKLHPLGQQLFLTGLETGALLSVGVAALMVLLGYGGAYLAGTSFLYNLLPFSLAVLLIALLGAGFMRGWWLLRTILVRWHRALAPLLAVMLATGTGILIKHPYFARPLAQFRLLVGGTTEMRALTLKHQIFAAYRRLDANEMRKMLVRAQLYSPDIADAARIFDIDIDVLNGLAAAESSFYPRTSADGGQGLFQITTIPIQAEQQAVTHLGSTNADMTLHRHNAFAAAATLRHYLKQMHGNMVLALLAYNIGPANGGLHHIMQQYSATDFITIQPYLQEKPRNYPIRVLSFALAFRINRVEQRLLPYEEGLNAIRIQHIGIPGL